MNIITNADVEKFIKLLKAGLKNGNNREIRNYTSGDCYDGTGIVKDYYVHIELSYHIDRETLEELFVEDDAGLTNQIDNMLKK